MVSPSQRAVTANPRAVAASVLARVAGEGRSLSAALPAALNDTAAGDRAFVQELCYGVLRWYLRLQAMARQLLHKPLKAKDADVECLILAGIYQLVYMRVPAHAAIAETVSGAEALHKTWAKALVNGVLRNFQRRADAITAAADAREEAALAHPKWLLGLLKEAWPQYWRAMVEANNARAPMALRVNATRTDRDAYLQRLHESGIAASPIAHSEHGVVLAHAIAAESLPGFHEGLVSVQDGAAQLAAPLLDAGAGERVLDACAAPGGKTAHILESLAVRGGARATVIALDRNAERLADVSSALGRLHLHAELVCGDAAEPGGWWDGVGFERILVDAPCTGTGVIRRHPDIKLLRRPGDVARLAERQRRILEGVWPLLKAGGRLVYATCSVVPAENGELLDAFLRNHPDAQALPLEAEWGRPAGAGRQILPGEDDMDGFYYACLTKHRTTLDPANNNS